MSMLPRPITGQLQVYLAQDGNVWAVNPSDGRAYKVGTGTNPDLPVSAPTPSMPNIGRVMYDCPLAIAGTETTGTRLIGTVPPAILPTKPFNYIIDNFYLYNSVNPSPGSTGSVAFGLLADLDDGSGPTWRTITNSQDLSAAGIAFPAGVFHKYLSLSPIAPNSGQWYNGTSGIQFAIVIGSTVPTKADNSLRMGMAIRPLYYT